MDGPGRLCDLGMLVGALFFFFFGGGGSGMVSVFMYLCHVGCMIVELGWLSFGSFLCLLSADWRRMALRVSNAVCSLLGS